MIVKHTQNTKLPFTYTDTDIQINKVIPINGIMNIIYNQIEKSTGTNYTKITCSQTKLPPGKGQ